MRPANGTRSGHSDSCGIRLKRVLLTLVREAADRIALAEEDLFQASVRQAERVDS